MLCIYHTYVMYIPCIYFFKVGCYNRCDEDISLILVFFSPFEEFRSRTAGIMESKGIYRVYEPSPVPTLYVGRVEDLSTSHSMLSGRKCNLYYST